MFLASEVVASASSRYSKAQWKKLAKKPAILVKNPRPATKPATREKNPRPATISLSLFLHLAGPEVQDIFETLEDTGTDLDTALTKLTAYFEPHNFPFERHNFRQTNQLQGETIEQYAIRLKHQVKFCEYDNPDDMIRDQIIEQCLSTRLRRRLLREPDLTLEKTMAIGRSFEASERQASQIEADSLKTTNLEVNAIRSAQDTKSPRPRFPAATTAQTGRSNIICYCCGNVGHRAKDPRCPAEGMSCNNCGKLGHFARVCRSTSN